MTSKDKKYSTVSFNSSYQDDLTKLCKDLKLSKGEFLELSIQYFTRTGLHPDNHLDDNRTQIAELRNTFISFTRTREKELGNKLLEIQSQISSLEPNNGEKEHEIISYFIEMLKHQEQMSFTLVDVLNEIRK